MGRKPVTNLATTRHQPRDKAGMHSGNAVSCIAVSAIVLMLLVPCTAVGQKVYSPEDPVVEQMVGDAVDFLETTTPPDLGEATLCALAIVEASKRYNQEVPRNSSFVTRTIDRILTKFPTDEQVRSARDGTDDNILKKNEVYFPALALILLAEFDDVKYAPQIKQLITMFEERQMESGAFTYLNQPNTGDTSQTQYAALALYVAKHHNFAIDVEVPKKALQWLVMTQRQGGVWLYKLRGETPNGPWRPSGGSDNPTLSIQAAALGTCYLLSDLLQLNPRKKSMSQATAIEDTGLPRTVMVYVKPKDGEGESLLNRTGPLVNFDSGRLQNAYRGGNAWLTQNFELNPGRWGFYYLYAFERYAWFREQEEGSLGSGAHSDWYDQGVEYFQEVQADNGQFINPKFHTEKNFIATPFAILFLVRSSEVLTQPGGDGELLGGQGFKKDTRLSAKNGAIMSSEAEKNLADMIEMMKEDDLDQEQLAMLTRSLKKAVVEFKQKDNKSRGEIKSFLREMVANRNYFRRLIAVRFLAGEQDMDNVPALIYSLGDPDFRICIEAHNGLRLISRRIDSLRVDDATRRNAVRDPGVLTPEEKSAMRLEFDRIKKEWTDWFLKIRPDADLLD